MSLNTYIFRGMTSIQGWFPKDIVKCVVPLVLREAKKEKNNVTLKAHGTGFLFSYNGLALIITNRHVAITSDDIGIIFSIPDKPSVYFNIKEGIHDKLGLSWVYHENKDVDLAVSFAPVIPLMSNLLYPENAIDDNLLQRLGEDVFFIGFPMGLGISERIYPILRSGIISQYLPDGTILIEGNGFPGSSGSPIWLKPQFFTAMKDGLAVGGRGPLLVGLVSKTIPFHESIHEENSGLFIAEPITRLTEILKSDSFQKQYEIVKMR